MIDSAEKERVITALKNCLDRPKCKNCPWHECDEAIDDDCVIPRSLAEKALSLVEELMTVEPKRGHWIDMGDFEQCSACTGTHLKEFKSYYGKAIWVKTRYCPWCGAKMDGGETDA